MFFHHGFLVIIGGYLKSSLIFFLHSGDNCIKNVHIISEFFNCKFIASDEYPLHRGSYMSAHVLLNLLNKLRKRDKMRGLPSILSLFRNEFNKFNKTRARMLDSIYHMALRLLRNPISGVKTLEFSHYVSNIIMDVITVPENQ